MKTRRRIAAVAAMSAAFASALGVAEAAWQKTPTGNSTTKADTVATPAGFSAACSNPGAVSTSANLSWTASTSTYVTGYTIVRTDTGGDTQTFTFNISGRTTTSFTDTNTLNYKNATITYTIKSVVSGIAWVSATATASLTANGSNKCN